MKLKNYYLVLVGNGNYFNKLKEISKLNVIVTVEYNGKILANKTFNNLSYVCFTNQDCGFVKIK